MITGHCFIWFIAKKLQTREFAIQGKKNANARREGGCWVQLELTDALGPVQTPTFSWAEPNSS